MKCRLCLKRFRSFRSVWTHFYERHSQIAFKFMLQVIEPSHPIEPEGPPSPKGEPEGPTEPGEMVVKQV